MPAVDNPNEYPFDCVGLLRVRLANGAIGRGTGALINEEFVVTCGHNIVYKDLLAIAARFYPAYTSDHEPARGTGLEIESGFVKKAFSQEGDRNWDIGVFRLAGRQYRKKYLVPTIVEVHGSLPNKDMLIAGYPSNQQFHMWRDEERVSGINVELHAFAYLHETAAGSSGSPLYFTEHGQARLYGVHSGFAENRPEDKVGVLMTQVTEAFVTAAMKFGRSNDFVNVID